MKKIWSFIIAIFPLISIAQNCGDFMGIQRSGITYPWKYDIQSKSGNFYAGKNSKLNIICNEGKDYRISFQISSSIMDNITIKVADNSGKVYYSTGVDESMTQKLDAIKKELASLQEQKAKAKSAKKIAELESAINKLLSEITNLENDIQNKQYMQTFNFEFTAASTVELVISVSADENCNSKGCVSVLVANKPSPQSSF